MKRVFQLISALLFANTIHAQNKLTFTVPDLYNNGLITINYKGDIVNGMANGKGVARDEGKDIVYEGMWKDNLFQGKGKYTTYHIGGEYIYNGDWEAGKRTGFGEYSNAAYHNSVTTITKYVGSWKDDVYSGKGKLTLTDKSSGYELESYDGEWLNGKRNGQGTAVKNGDKWEGEWKDNLMHGKGTLSNINNGESYVGNWLNGRKHGIGTYKWGNGDEYEGNWFLNNKQGKGIYKWKDGRKYDGEWVNNKKHGKATLFFANGDKYVGEFLNDWKEGSGIYTWTNGDEYNGEWVKDQRTGYGKYTFQDGRVYLGQFIAGELQGRGKMTYQDGKIEDGIWAANKFIRLANPIKKIKYPNGSFYEGEAVDNLEAGEDKLKFVKEGKGKMIFQDGGIYDGEWHNNNWHGQGKLTDLNGVVHEGKFENGEMVYGEVKTATTYYKGSLKNNLPNGWGIYRSAIKRPDGTTTSEEYKGEWLNGKRNGNGEITINGCTYSKGIFIDNAIPKDGYRKNLCNESETDD